VYTCDFPGCKQEFVGRAACQGGEAEPHVWPDRLVSQSVVNRANLASRLPARGRSGGEIPGVRVGPGAKAVAFTKNESRREARGGAHLLFLGRDRDMVIYGNFCVKGVG
jgi:hypothetical protein